MNLQQAFGVAEGPKSEALAVSDRDVLGDKGDISHEEAMHFGQLTEEERAIEKKLVRKIDIMIMPLMVLVYLMNYIDRYVRALPSPSPPPGQRANSIYFLFCES